MLLMDHQVSGKVIQSEVVALLTLERFLKVNVWKGENCRNIISKVLLVLF